MREMDTYRHSRLEAEFDVFDKDMTIIRTTDAWVKFCGIGLGRSVLEVIQRQDVPNFRSWLQVNAQDPLQLGKANIAKYKQVQCKHPTDGLQYNARIVVSFPLVSEEVDNPDDSTESYDGKDGEQDDSDESENSRGSAESIEHPVYIVTLSLQSLKLARGEHCVTHAVDGIRRRVFGSGEARGS